MSRKRKNGEEDKNLPKAKIISKDKRYNKNNKNKNRSRLLDLSLPILFLCVSGFAIFLYLVDQQIFKPLPNTSSIIFGSARDIDVLLNYLENHIHKIDPDRKNPLPDDELNSIKDILSGIQSRLTSLKIQTSQYEQMSVKIPGGPKSFISSTEKELDSMMANLLILKNKITFFAPKGIWGKLPKRYSLDHLYFQKKNTPFSDPNGEGEKILKILGIYLLPENWNTHDEEVLMELRLEAQNYNISLLESYKTLEAARKILDQLGQIYQNFEEAHVQGEQELNLMKSNFPEPVALFVYNYVWKWYSIQEFWEKDSTLTLNREDLEKMVKYLDMMANALKASKKLYDENEQLLRSITPLKFSYMARAKEYMEASNKEQQNQETKDNGSLLGGYAGLHAKVYHDLVNLRKRVLKLAEA